MSQTSLKYAKDFESAYMKDKAADYQYIIVGLGKTGLACAHYLHARGIHFAVVDSRDIPPGLQELQTLMPEVKLFLGGFDKNILASSEYLLLSPGVSRIESAIIYAEAQGVKLIGDVELFAQLVTKPVIAITGSNGKSTVTTLVAELLSAAGYRVKAGGNLGIASLALLDDENTDVYVLELSSFQLETLKSLNPVSAVMLNISADHMDRYDSLNDYVKAKANVYQGDGLMVINKDDQYSVKNSDSLREQLVFSVKEELTTGYSRKVVNNIAGLYKNNECIVEEEQLKVKGLHNSSNVLAALALIDSFNIQKSILQQVLISFPGLAHRCELIMQQNGISWYNDSKGTNVGATCASIQGLSSQGEIILLAGGDSKGAAFDELALVCQNKVKLALLFGKDAKKLFTALNTKIDCEYVKNLQMAVEKANTLASNGNIVLLSPACASLDMFKNYEERGEVFVAAVNRVVRNS